MRNEDELAEATGLPSLATIPRLPPTAQPTVVTARSPDSTAAEAFRDLRTSLRFLSLDRPLPSVQVTSPKPGDGKTTTAVNLAVASAAAGQRTVLVDLDLRKPQVHSYFGIANDGGFTDVLLDGVATREIAHAPPDFPLLRVVPSGPLPPDPSELISGADAAHLLRDLADGADLVIIDSPPVLAVSDPTVLSGLVSGVILVVSAGSTDRRQVGRALDRLRQVDAPLLGTVFNGDSDHDRERYRYTYGYRHAPSQDGRDGASAEPAPAADPS